MSKLGDMCGMFFGCESLTFLDLSDWCVVEVTDRRHMFNDCTNLRSKYSVKTNEELLSKIIAR